MKVRASRRIIRIRIQPHPNDRSGAKKQNNSSIPSSINLCEVAKPTIDDRRIIDSKDNVKRPAVRQWIEKQHDDQHDVVTNHHRKREKKKMNPRSWLLLFGIVVTTLIILALSITLGVLLTSKPQSKNRIAVLRWNTSGITIAGRGSGGNYSNDLIGPYGLAWDSSNTLYIVEIDAHRIRKWIPGATSGTIIAGLTNGVSTNHNNGFNHPVDLFVETNGDMYITDRTNSRLQLWLNGSSTGITVAGVGSNGSFVLVTPSAIVRNPSTNEFYIASSSLGQIMSYPTGSIVAGGSGLGNAINLLNYPIGLIYDDYTESLIIPNYYGHSLVRWTLGEQQWTLIHGVPGTTGATSSLLDGPIGITMDPMGNIYCADSNNQRIQLIMNGQSEGVTIAGITGISGSNSTTFDSPYWVKLDNQLNLYVSDKYNGRIQKFLRY